jgi:hypothetical protein
MKSLSEHINESLVNEAKDVFDWSKYDEEEKENLDMRCEELSLEYVIIPANKVKYNDAVADWLLEYSDSVVEKPFDREAKALLKSFGIDPNNVEVFRHTAVEDYDYAEVILYTPKGSSTEGEDYDFAVQELFPGE